MNCPYWQGADGGGGQCGFAGRLLTIVTKSVTDAKVTLLVEKNILNPEQRTLGVHHSRVVRRL